jgi:hypothetical protein
MESSDTIFFFNFSLEDSLNGVSSRIGTHRTDCPFIENEFDPEFKEFLIHWQIETRPKVLELLKKYKDKNIIIFTNRNDKEEYIKRIKKL